MNKDQRYLKNAFTHSYQRVLAEIKDEIGRGVCIRQRGLEQFSEYLQRTKEEPVIR